MRLWYPSGGQYLTGGPVLVFGGGHVFLGGIFRRAFAAVYLITVIHGNVLSWLQGCTIRFHAIS